MNAQPARVLQAVLAALDRLEIPYLIGGSTASTIHGWPRMTRDVDIVALVLPEHVDLLVAELQSEFNVDAGQIREALRFERSFNLIHLQSAFKFDVFPVGSDRYQRAQFDRRRPETTTLFGPDPIEVSVNSPEDVILSKLQWYRQGGCVSEQQWNDVLGVIAVQNERLDLDYLQQWAKYLRISDLLRQALAERQESRPSDRREPGP